MNRREQPPCTKTCPRRSAVPNCHNPNICPDWAKYLERKEKEDAKIEAEREKDRAVTAAMRWSDGKRRSVMGT